MPASMMNDFSSYSSHAEGMSSYFRVARPATEQTTQRNDTEAFNINFSTAAKPYPILEDAT